MNNNIKKDVSRRQPQTPARYANCFQIGHSAFEFLIAFGQEERTHTRIYVTPLHAQMLSQLLIQALNDHRQLFDPPTRPAEEPGG